MNVFGNFQDFPRYKEYEVMPGDADKDAKDK